MALAGEAAGMFGATDEAGVDAEGSGVVAERFDDIRRRCVEP